MRSERIADFRLAIGAGQGIDVTIVMPCLNEVACLPHCIANAQAALAMIEDELGLLGEVVIADNGSTDGSQALAHTLGARVVMVARRGYGAALIGGTTAAFGSFVLMGDADGSYDFTDGVAMIRSLHEGADLCMGSRFKGGIVPGAMPWKNRHIGNPVLTGILNILFHAGIDDAHCGLRAIRKDAFLRLDLTGTGMEFASEMVIKAALKQLTITQSPAKLLADLRDRPPHLRPWRDGWRHLRYLFMLSPTWLFAIPGITAMTAAACVLLVAVGHLLGVVGGETPFGTSWTIAAGFLFTTGHLATLLALATHLISVRRGYLRLGRVLTRYARLLTLETMLVTGAAMILISFLGLLAIGSYWGGSDFAALPNTLPLVLAALLGATGAQNVLGGFLLSITAGHEAHFMPGPPQRDVLVFAKAA
jgi:hypothetical protein